MKWWFSSRFRSVLYMPKNTQIFPTEREEKERRLIYPQFAAASESLDEFKAELLSSCIHRLESLPERTWFTAHCMV